MGMFDTLTCNYPLPGDPPAFVAAPGHAFQTKSLDCQMATYNIAVDGRLMQVGGSWAEDDEDATFFPRHLADFTGVVDFYDGTSVGSHGEITYTTDGSDAEWVRYQAEIVRGQLTSLRQAERSKKPAVKARALAEQYPMPTEAEVAADLARQAEPLLGRHLYLLHGGGEVDAGDVVEVVFETDRQLVLRKVGGPAGGVGSPYTKPGDLTLEGRHARDRILFDSFEHARTVREESSAAYEAERARFRAAVAAKAGGGHSCGLL